MTPLNMKEGVERFDVNKTTSVMKNTRLNIAHNDDMTLFGEKIQCNGDMFGGESPGSDSPSYEDFVDFDPSTFRLTPQSTISPKRDAGLMNEFKSVDSYESVLLLSAEESADDLSMYKLDDEDLVVKNDNEENEVLPLLQDVIVPFDNDDPKTNVALVEDFSPSNSDDVEMVDVSLVEDDLNAGNVSFDLSSTVSKGLVDVFSKSSVELKEVDKVEDDKEMVLDDDNKSKRNNQEQYIQRDSLDSGRLMNYLKNDKVNEICKRLKSDLKGTKQYNYEELPLTDQIPFSERVYNYISELKAYSSISSQDRTTSSRLTSLDLKTLQSLDTIDTVDTEERVKDFEQALESQEGQNELSVDLMLDSYKSLGNMEVDEVEPMEEEEGAIKEQEMKEKETLKQEVEDEYDNENKEDKLWVEQSKDSREMSFEMGLKSLEYPTEHEYSNEDDDQGVYSELRDKEAELPTVLDTGMKKDKDRLDKLPEDVEMEMSEYELDVNKDLEMRMNEYNLETRLVKEYNEVGTEMSEQIKDNDEDKMVTNDINEEETLRVDEHDKDNKEDKYNDKERDRDKIYDYERPELVKGSTTDSLNYVDDKLYGLECMTTNYGVNLVYSCLRSIKIQVGDNLHEYDAYNGTKKMMNKFIELMKKINFLEKKLRGDFLSLEKNDYNLEVTRNSYVTLIKNNNRLEGLLEYYKEYEKLQKESIKLKSNNIGLIRREILNKLNEFQNLSKINENKEDIEIIENRLNEMYNKNGFFILPLYNDTHKNYDFMYLINYNYYNGYNINYNKNKWNNSNKEYNSNNNYNYNNNYNNRNNNNKCQYQNQNQTQYNTLYNSYEKRYYSLNAITPKMLEKLKVLEYLPYKAKKVIPDLELKLFMYFQSDTSSSNLSSLSNDKCFISSNPLSSGSSCNSTLPCLDFLNDNNTNNYNSTTYNYGKYNKNNNSNTNTNNNKDDKNKTELGLMGVNLEVDVNMLVDLYSIRNDLKLLLYSPFHKDTPYYRFKLDLVDCFNHLLSLKMSNYVDELTENIQLMELLEVLVQFTNELNLKFVYYLKLFNDLLKLSSNHYYLLYDRSNSNSSNELFNSNTDNNNSNTNVNTSTNLKLYSNTNYNTNYNNRNNNNKDKVLKLMLTFKNNVPCLWCNVYFNFDYKKDKNKYLQYFNKDFKDGLIYGIKFEFVHKLNKTYFETYESTLIKLNDSINGANKNNNLVEHIVSTLNSQQYYI